RTDARGPRAPGISTRPVAAASAQAWRTEEGLDEEARRGQVARREEVASRGDRRGLAPLGRQGRHAAGTGGNAGLVRLRSRVVRVLDGDRSGGIRGTHAVVGPRT